MGMTESDRFYPQAIPWKLPGLLINISVSGKHLHEKEKQVSVVCSMSFVRCGFYQITPQRTRPKLAARDLSSFSMASPLGPAAGHSSQCGHSSSRIRRSTAESSSSGLPSAPSLPAMESRLVARELLLAFPLRGVSLQVRASPGSLSF